MTETLRSQAWLRPVYGASLGGDLQLADGRLSFTTRASQVAGMSKHNLRVLEKWVQHPGLAKKLGWGAIIKGADEPVKVFDVPFDQIEKATFPWYDLGMGVKLEIRGELFHFQFARPANTRLPASMEPEAALEGIGEFFQKGDIGKAWKAALSTKM